LQVLPETCVTRREKMADVSNYIRVASIKDNVVNIELKGFWSDQVIEEYGPEIQRVFKEAVTSLRGKRFILVADWSESPVFGIKAQGHLAQSMTIFKEHNGYKVIEIVPKALVRMGLKEAAAQTGEDDFRIVVGTHAEAREVLERLKSEL
jgi:hypothetical protein